MGLRTRIKVCGMTQVKDAQGAVDLGVDAVGFIFAEKSPRYISPERAREITQKLPPMVSKVGVFVDMEYSELEEIVDYVGLNTIQLHGQEPPEFCRQLASSLPWCSIVKAFRVGEQTKATDFEPYGDCVNGYLLDTHVKGQAGGTGKSFDWTIVNSLNLDLPVILAGGLGPENIQEAISVVKPFAVDVNSGVESAPGIKNMELLRALVSEVYKSTSAWGETA